MATKESIIEKWDRLTEEERERNGHYAYFAAFERLVADFDVSGNAEDWLSGLDIYGRIAVFDMLTSVREAAKLEGVRLGLEAGAKEADDVAACDSYLEEAAELVEAVADRIRTIDPEALWR